MTKTNQTNPKNKIVIFEGCYENKKKIELFNFQKMDYCIIEGRAFVRVLCDSRYYYFKAQETTISEVIIY